MVKDDLMHCYIAYCDHDLRKVINILVTVLILVSIEIFDLSEEIY